MTKTTQKGAQICAPASLSIEFVLDETGSMSRCRNATIGGFNDFLKEQKDVPGVCQMTLTKFEGGKLVTPFEDLDLGYVPTLTSATFVPGGGTNLFDAILARVKARRDAMANWVVKPNVLLVVMTDGDDNMSTNPVTEVRSLVEMVQGDGWTCVFLGADQQALVAGGQMGFQPGNIKSFASAEMRETMRGLSASTTVYRSALATGAQTKNFF